MDWYIYIYIYIYGLVDVDQYIRTSSSNAKTSSWSLDYSEFTDHFHVSIQISLSCYPQRITNKRLFLHWVLAMCVSDCIFVFTHQYLNKQCFTPVQILKRSLRSHVYMCHKNYNSNVSTAQFNPNRILCCGYICFRIYYSIWRPSVDKLHGFNV
jgi:hypothetical protein